MNDIRTQRRPGENTGFVAIRKSAGSRGKLRRDDIRAGISRARDNTSRRERASSPVRANRGASAGGGSVDVGVNGNVWTTANDDVYGPCDWQVSEDRGIKEERKRGGSIRGAKPSRYTSRCPGISAARRAEAAFFSTKQHLLLSTRSVRKLLTLRRRE